MIECLAAFALAAVSVGDIPALATRVETEARSVTALAVSLAASPNDPAFPPALDAFATDAMQLSDSLRAAGVTEDLPCIFKGISEDARVRGAEILATSGEARITAVTGLTVLLRDAAQIAPMAGKEAADRARAGH